MRIKCQQEPITETSLSSYFKRRLTRYARQFKPPPHEDTCWYLGSLLERFGRSDQLFCYQNEQMALRPLALLYQDALETHNSQERCLMLQQLGDMALFLGALFPERYHRKGILQDYFVGMGGSAYDYLAENARTNRHIFAELANTFTRMLELVANACSKKQKMTTEEVLGLYQRWLTTRDPVTERQLRALGINLSETNRLQ